MITATATPMCDQPTSIQVSTSEAPAIAAVEKLMPFARAPSRAFCEESSSVRTWKIPNTESSVPTAAMAIGRNIAANCMRYSSGNAATPRAAVARMLPQ